jgi:hypothetical protein
MSTLMGSTPRRSHNQTGFVGAGLVPALGQGAHEGRPYERGLRFRRAAFGSSSRLALPITEVGECVTRGEVVGVRFFPS